jgi:hypothetical protein
MAALADVLANSGPFRPAAKTAGVTFVSERITSAW